MSAVPELANTVAAILAGGLGTRLRTVVADRPKVLAKVSGKPFIEYLLDQLAGAGLRTVVLCTGFMGEQVEQHLGATYKGMKLRYSCESSPLGTGGALRLALPMFDGAPSVLVMNGDSYCDARLDGFAVWHEAHGSSATLMLTETPDTRRYGRVQVDHDGKIIRFQEKAATEGPGWINAGIYLVTRGLIETMPSDRAVSIEREIFPAWINNGLFGYRSEGRLWDIGVPDAYTQANVDFVNSITAS
jgi:NDP-sugar pyrophosphorylase family protein